MTPCADPVSRAPAHWLVPLLALALVAGCAGGPSRKASKPAPTADADVEAEAPAKPDKGDPDSRFTEALQLLKDRQMKEAREAFLQLAKDFPEHSGPFTDLAIIQYQARQPQLAVANFEKATRINPDNATAWNWLGIIAREAGDYPKAESAYGKALAARPDYAAAHLNLAVLHDVYTKQPAKALDHYREYQSLTGGERPIVTAWIRELEAKLPAPAPAPAPDAADTGAP